MTRRSSCGHEPPSGVTCRSRTARTSRESVWPAYGSTGTSTCMVTSCKEKKKLQRERLSYVTTAERHGTTRFCVGIQKLRARVSVMRFRRPPSLCTGVNGLEKVLSRPNGVVNFGPIATDRPQGRGLLWASTSRSSVIFAINSFAVIAVSFYYSSVCAPPIYRHCFTVRSSRCRKLRSSWSSCFFCLYCVRVSL